ncbi:phosphoglucomutase [Danaus plexippus]|nr:phosphoglucomutase [Danaus plexippus]
MLTVEEIETVPFEGQQPGTSGLRKKVKVFLQKNYVENFIQSILNVNEELEGCTLVVGGDGRYLVKEVVDTIIKICAGNGVGKLIIGQNGLLSTPAVSHLIRKNETLGGIILTASHNPGGVDNDFGIKFNTSNGGPAPDGVTNEIYRHSTIIKSYKIVPNIKCDITTIGITRFKIEDKDFVVEVIDSVKDYLDYMKEIFNFPLIKTLLEGSEDKKKFNVLIDSMNGVTGPYVKRIFVDELGATEDNLRRVVPMEDFGGIHPDPNLTYAEDLVREVRKGDYDFGAAFDGDGDRNMILGRGAMFVTPADSLAILASWLHVIPYFQRTGVKGFARSMPTAAAVDLVAKEMNKEMFEVPTGWKYFGNLMDADRLSLCGEESFGTGSDHIREKDGVWAALAWLNVIAHSGLSVKELLMRHWRKYGRNYFARHDFEECSLDSCRQLMTDLERTVTAEGFVGSKHYIQDVENAVVAADNFSYMDPIDRSVALNQGIRLVFENGSRIIYRLSGTGSQGATLRIYLEAFTPCDGDIHLSSEERLQSLVTLAMRFGRVRRYTGRDKPTVIT